MEIDDSVTVRVDFAEPGHRVYVTVCFPKRGSGDPQIKAGAAGTNTDTDTGEEGAYSQTQTQAPAPRPSRVFIHLGRPGSDERSFAEAIAELLTLYLEEGGSPAKAAAALHHIKGKTQGIHRSRRVESVPDAIATALEEAVAWHGASGGGGEGERGGSRGLQSADTQTDAPSMGKP